MKYELVLVQAGEGGRRNVSEQRLPQTERMQFKMIKESQVEVYLLQGEKRQRGSKNWTVQGERKKTHFVSSLMRTL